MWLEILFWSVENLNYRELDISLYNPQMMIIISFFAIKYLFCMLKEMPLKWLLHYRGAVLYVYVFTYNYAQIQIFKAFSQKEWHSLYLSLLTLIYTAPFKLFFTHS